MRGGGLGWELRIGAPLRKGFNDDACGAGSKAMIVLHIREAVSVRWKLVPSRVTLHNGRYGIEIWMVSISWNLPDLAWYVGMWYIPLYSRFASCIDLAPIRSIMKESRLYSV